MGWFDATEFRRLVSGRRRGLFAALTRALLAVAELPYGVAVSWRNRRFDRGRREIHRVGVPVVSIGNITAGGTGKTPLVAWLAKWFGEKGIRVCVISRGYGAVAGASNDEARELALQLPNVPHLQNADRVAAARRAIEELGAQLILLDDAFQHRRLHRDLDVVLLDALEPFGFGHLLPRGLLREPLSGLQRADVLVLSRADAVDEQCRAAIRQEAFRHAGDAAWVELAHRPVCLAASSGESRPVETLRGRRVAAFCGIGNPAGFRHSLEACGYDVVAFREFPDHHPFPSHDVESLAQWAAGFSDLEAILCTQKDLVKIAAERLGPLRLWALAISVEVVSGGEALEERLRQTLRGS